ncbi:MAG: hypothetical protein KDK70_19690 [Myxococcales bacterium]|nr:hypothetical protein [Myxococcales bacterium]
MTRLLGLGIAIAIPHSMSCVRLDEDHCIVNGGDVSCIDDRICVTDVDGLGEKSDHGDGCVSNVNAAVQFEGQFVHVQYGLPSRLDAVTDVAEDDIQSVAGVLALAALESSDASDSEHPCVVQEDLIHGLEPLWLEIEAVRAHLEDRARVRAGDAALSLEQVQAINRFNEAINSWLDECGS